MLHYNGISQSLVYCDTDSPHVLAYATGQRAIPTQILLKKLSLDITILGDNIQRSNRISKMNGYKLLPTD